MRIRSFCLFSACGLMAMAASAEEIVIPFLNLDVSVSDMLKEDFWSSAVKVKFSDTEKSGSDYKFGAAAAVAAAVNGLCAKFVCEGNFEERCSVAPDSRDAALWKEPSVEIFLRPSFVNGGYYQIIIARNGALFDAFFTPEKTTGWAERAMRWNPDGILRKTLENGSGWEILALLPWRSLGLTERPPRGTVWRGKLVRNMPQAGAVQRWPEDDSGDNHSKANSAFLIFGGRNLLENSGFERDTLNWKLCYSGKEMNDGTCLCIRDAAFKGEKGLRLTCVRDKGCYPQIWAGEFVRAQGNSRYKVSLRAKGEGELYLRWTRDNPKTKVGCPLKLQKDWREFTAEIETLNDGRDIVNIGLGLQLSYPGVADIDEISLTRVNRADREESRDTLKKAHPSHGLGSMLGRRFFPPYEKLSHGGSLDCQPLIITDSATGRLLTRWVSGGVHRYCDMSPWNANGTLLAFNNWFAATRTLWIMDTSTGLARKCPYSGRWIWDRFDPDKMYLSTSSNRKLCVYHPATGNLTGLANFQGEITVMPQSMDGKMLILTEHLRQDGKRVSVLYWLKNDGSVVKKHEAGDLIHAAWFSKDDKYSVAFGWENQSLPAPGALLTMDGKTIPSDKSATGHCMASPGGLKIAKSFGGAIIMNPDGGGAQLLLPHRSQHVDWSVTPDWFLSSAPSGIFRVWTDRPNHYDYLCVPNSDLYGFRTYYTENHVAASFDGTKAAYGSQMLGTLDLWSVIIAPPMPPTDVRLTKDADKYKLEWKAPPRAREITKYRVYKISGDKAEIAGETPADAPSFTVADISGDPAWFVCGLEHSGVEGDPSEAVSAPGKRFKVPEKLFAGRFAPPPEVKNPRALSVSKHDAGLSWDAVRAPGLWFYRVYRSHDKTFTPSQAELAGTPFRPQFLDWGLESGKEYFYRVSAVCQNEAEGRPSEVLPVKTAEQPDKTVLEEKLDFLSEKGQICKFNVNLPAASRFIMWLEASPSQTAMSGALRVKIDGSDWRRETVSFAPISKGHAGAMPGYWSWTPVLNAAPYDSEEPGVELTKGAREISMEGDGTPVHIRRAVITNDMDWLPPGIWNWLPPQNKDK